MLRAALIALTVLALPASATAAERFVGVLEDGRRLVRFTSEGYGLSSPKRVRLMPGERIVALGTRHGELVGVGSSARLYAISLSRGVAQPIGPPFPEGLRGSRFSLAQAPGATRGRLLSDVGQDLTIDLMTGETEPGPGLRVTDGALARPAADIGPDGRLVGLQLTPDTAFRETAPGTSTLAAARLEKPGYAPRLAEPLGFQVGSDGQGYALAVLSDRRRVRQSVLFTLDPPTGRLALQSENFLFFQQRLTTFVSLGHVADDTAGPRMRVTGRSRVSVRGLLEHLLPLRVKVSEGAYVSVSLRIGGRHVGSGSGIRDTPGTVPLRGFYVRPKERTRLRRSVGRRARLVITANDLKGNDRKVTRTVRLTR